MELTPQQREELENNISIAAYDIRGRVLQRAIEIESMIEIYLGEHFTKDETTLNELVCLVIAPRMTFEQKVSVFRYLVDKYNPEFKVENKDYHKELVHIYEERNVYAHYPVSFSPKALIDFHSNKVVTFARLKEFTNDGEKMLYGERFMSEADVNGFLSLMRKHIDSLRKLIGHSSHPSE